MTDTKFKVLFDMSFHEYKEELSRLQRVDEKISKLFVIVNILMLISVNLISKSGFWKYYTGSHGLVIFLNTVLIGCFFSYLFLALLNLLEGLKLRDLKKLNTDEESIVDIVYNDEPASHLHYKLHKTFCASIEENKLIINDKTECVGKAILHLKYASYSFIALLFIFFMILIKGYLS